MNASICSLRFCSSATAKFCNGQHAHARSFDLGRTSLMTAMNICSRMTACLVRLSEQGRFKTALTECEKKPTTKKNGGDPFLFPLLGPRHLTISAVL